MRWKWLALGLVVVSIAGLVLARVAVNEGRTRDPELEEWRRNAARATKGEFAFEIDEAFEVTRGGERVTAIAGHVKAGKAEVGDRVRIPVSTGEPPVEARLLAIEMFQKQLDVANPGDWVGLVVQGVGKASLRKGDVIEMGR